MCCGSKKTFSPRVVSEAFQSMSVNGEYVLMEFIGTGSIKKYRVPDTNRVYYAGGNREKKFFQVHREDVQYFLDIKKNRIPQFKVREDFVYKPNKAQAIQKEEEIQENLALDEEEFFYENRDPQFEELSLTDIRNIGKASEQKLIDAGVDSVDKLAELSLQQLIDITGLPEHKAKNVMEQLNVQLQEEENS